MAIGNPVDNRPAKARDDPDNHADQCTPYGQPFIGPPVTDPGKPSRTQRRPFGNSLVFAQKRDDFGYCKDAQPDNDQLQPIGQIGKIIACHPQLAIEGAFADGCDKHADTSRHQPFQRHPPGQNAHHRQSESRYHQQFGRFEFQHNRSCNKDEECQEKCANKPAKKRRGKGCRQGPCRKAFLGHRETVKNGGLRGGGPGNSHQHRCECIGCRHHRHHADHQRKAVNRLQSKHERQHK